MDIHILRQQGLSIRKIANLRKISRNAVRRALRSTTPPSGKRQCTKPTKIAPYTAQIDMWLRDEIRSLWSAERIFDELQERGYPGGCTAIRKYVREHRPGKQRTAEARFFVKPGQQVQIDWAEMGTYTIQGISQKVYAFVAVMAWSRQLFIRFTVSMDILSWLDCHVQAFSFFGGVPEETLIDNLKTGVISRAGNTVRWHPKYHELAVALGFQPLAHFPLRPQTKGRVERIVRFVRERFFLGREIVDLDSYNDEALQWLRKKANTRIHRVTKERPDDRFLREKNALHPLIDFDIFLEEARIADAYGYIAFQAVRYSIPHTFARKPVTLHLRLRDLTVLADGKEIARHVYAVKGTRFVNIPEHAVPKPKPRHEQFEILKEQIAERLGECGLRYAKEIESRAPHAPLAFLREVLDRLDDFGADIVEKSIVTLLKFSIIRRNELSQLCYRFGKIPDLKLPIRTTLPQVNIETRDLSGYDEVFA